MTPPTLKRPTHNHAHPTISPTHSAIPGVFGFFLVLCNITSHVDLSRRHLLHHHKLQRACSHHQDKLWYSTHPLQQRTSHKRVRHITLTAILISNSLLGTSKITWGNIYMQFPRITQYASSSPIIILRYPYAFGHSYCPDQANCLLRLRDQIGIFEFILLFPHIWSRISWAFFFTSNDPIGLSEFIVKYSLISSWNYFPFKIFHWLIRSDSLIFPDQVKSFSSFEWFDFTIQSWLPYLLDFF